MVKPLRNVFNCKLFVPLAYFHSRVYPNSSCHVWGLSGYQVLVPEELGSKIRFIITHQFKWISSVDLFSRRLIHTDSR
ncbi:unnamed protein product [Lathyrus sativus]|nr:unnamed protein product [Lathyrus sativus]